MTRPRAAATSGLTVTGEGAIADEHVALRRVATLVARGAPPTEVFTAVTGEAARLLGADIAGMSRFDPDGMQTVVAAWPPGREHVPVGTRLPVGPGDNIAGMVRATARPARVQDWTTATGEVAESVRALGVRCSVGSPIIVDGRLWGVLIVDSRGDEPLPAITEERLDDFTALVATAVSNTEARRELGRLADEQSALRRVATLIARGISPSAAFHAVASELGRFLGAHIVHLARHDPGDTLTVVAGWSERGDHLPAGTRLPLTGDSAAALVLRTGRPARVDDYAVASGPIAEALRMRGIRSSVGAPILVEGRMWGAMIVSSTAVERQPGDTEAHLSGFTEIVATAIANASARAEVTRLADEQAALRRVATLVARAPEADVVFAAVAEEVGTVLGADVTRMLRYEDDGTVTVVAGWGRPPMRVALGTRLTLEGDDGVAARVLATGRPARMESYEDAGGSLGAMLWELGIRSAVGAPVVVGGRLWGVAIAGSAGLDPLTEDSEERIAEFTELVATAIANAEDRAKLVASRARVVAAADDERRRIERNLHDGAQQRLVSLGVAVRAVQADAPDGLRERLDDVVAGLGGVLDELQEISRGLHPAILAQGGLGAALRSLARRSTIPAALRVDVPDRLPERVEVAAYYVASEGLANAAKHAGASSVSIAAEVRDGLLAISVEDDGAGGADPAGGSGLLGLADRVEALGGRLAVSSPPGGGTRLQAELPLV